MPAMLKRGKWKFKVYAKRKQEWWIKPRIFVTMLLFDTPPDRKRAEKKLTILIQVMKVFMHFWPFNVNDATLIVIETFGSNSNLQELFIQNFFWSWTKRKPSKSFGEGIRKGVISSKQNKNVTQRTSGKAGKIKAIENQLQCTIRKYLSVKSQAYLLVFTESRCKRSTGRQRIPRNPINAISTKDFQKFSLATCKCKRDELFCQVELITLRRWQF